ncbi:alpha-1,2-fucosyltransferase [Halorubrum sp. GN11GM_10-3_MGM]|uniref:alpha-1,2-fucosyltransferase n=1 Tax=Halorubrum sp. GN11GM_10-3_MGM TaxID=2518111 RepID=UPI0010F93FEB|nr:alpha-1,2-fucosyltransferase [Halorubrum sp. GN11GM_10-3_MGM]TKX69199.1 alpha-1,2-fucosyltransferase [Halorubrum sp. GN11GM_10-3_MGM]
MIVVKLWGGLGNQLFQYAIGQKITHHTSHQLKFDISWFDRKKSETDRDLRLQHFNTNIPIASKVDIKRSMNPKFVPAELKSTLAVYMSRISTFFKRIPSHMFPEIVAEIFDYYYEIQEKNTSKSLDWPYARRHYQDIVDIAETAYLDGYWQSYKYFKDVWNKIEDDFIISTPPTEKNKKTAEKIINSEHSVGVHVRRGDFDDQGSSLPIEYYNKCVNKISSEMNEVNFFVVSNDTQWTENNITKDKSIEIINHNNGSKDYEDFRLLRLCDDQVISNSTFSWWAAWLNKNQNKNILYPIEEYNVSFDYYPDKWKGVKY